MAFKIKNLQLLAELRRKQLGKKPKLQCILTL